MTVATRRTADEARSALSRWFTTRTGLRDVEVTDVVASKAGFSNESFICEVGWTDDGSRDLHKIVLRIQPTEHQLFAKSDVALQARVLRGLDETSCVPVPRVPFVELEPKWFGAPFYLMDFVAGSVPSDVPSYHARGWVADLSAENRARLYDNALVKLADLHRCGSRERLGFLKPAGASPLAAYVDGVVQWAASFDADLVVNRDVIDAALRFVRHKRPAEGEPGIVWGDARIGNMIFSDDLSVAALLDWEAAAWGPAEIDVGWWLMFEEYICEASGLSRLEGIPDRSAILARYESLVGRKTIDIVYFEVLAALVFSIINSRLATLLIDLDFDEDKAKQFARRSTGLIARGLEAAGVSP